MLTAAHPAVRRWPDGDLDNPTAPAAPTEYTAPEAADAPIGAPERPTAKPERAALLLPTQKLGRGDCASSLDFSLFCHSRVLVRCTVLDAALLNPDRQRRARCDRRRSRRVVQGLDGRDAHF